MGSDKNENPSGVRLSKKGRDRKSANTFFSWRPNKEEAAVLLTAIKEPEDVLEKLDDILERGLFLKVQRRAGGDTIVASLIEQSDWGDRANGLSVWHEDAARAVLAVIFAADKVYPLFPRGDWPPSSSAFDW